MTTKKAIQQSVVRLQGIYQQTRFDLMRLSDTALTEMMHEADEYKVHVDFSERTAGEIVSSSAYMILEERKQIRKHD